jgi:hypothetical protein
MGAERRSAPSSNPGREHALQPDVAAAIDGWPADAPLMLFFPVVPDAMMGDIGRRRPTAAQRTTPDGAEDDMPPLQADRWSF